MYRCCHGAVPSPTMSWQNQRALEAACPLARRWSRDWRASVEKSGMGITSAETYP
jgi:hypothetical protein